MDLLIPGIRNRMKISGTMDRINGAPNEVMLSWNASAGFGSRSGESGSRTPIASSAMASTMLPSAQFRPRRSLSASGSSFGMSDMSPSTGVSRASLGSTTLSVSHQPIPMTSTLEAAMKNQLTRGLIATDGSSTRAASSVMPASIGSMADGMKLAEKPPDTPAKAAAIPASG